MKNTLTIREWSPEERPREKLIEKGVQSLDSAELLAILIGSGTQEKSAVDLGRELLYTFGTLDNLARAKVTDLTAIRGIGEARAVSIVSAFELCRRRETQCRRVFLAKNAVEIASYMRSRLMDLKYEEFWIIYLNMNREIILEMKLSAGGRHAAIIDRQVVLGEGYKISAHSFIMVHNHPSGSIRPSAEDVVVTDSMKKRAENFGMPLRDHIIVAQHGYFSFFEEGYFKEHKGPSTLSPDFTHQTSWAMPDKKASQAS